MGPGTQLTGGEDVLPRTKPFDASEWITESRTSADWLDAVPSTARQRKITVRDLLQRTAATREQLEEALKNPKIDRKKIALKLVRLREAKKRAPSTIVVRLSFLVSYFHHLDPTFLKDNGLKANVPQYAAKTARYVANKPRALNRDQIRAILTWATSIGSVSVHSVWFL